jgi:hypothetical protein
MTLIKNTNATLVADASKNASGNVQGWVQTEKKAHQALARLCVKAPTAAATIHFFTARMNRGTNAVVISHESVAEWLGVSKSAVIRAVKTLQEANFIQILKAGRTNVYVINQQVAWQGKRGHRYAVFGAELIIHENEQDKTVEELQEDAKRLMPVPAPHFDERVYVTNDQIDPPDQQEMDLP